MSGFFCVLSGLSTLREPQGHTNRVTTSFCPNIPVILRALS